MKVDDHPHDLDAEYIDPADTLVLAVFDRDDVMNIRFAVPCPECGESFELVASVDTVEGSDLELPLDDVPDHYD